jgi:hypothetical protein
VGHLRHVPRGVQLRGHLPAPADRGTRRRTVDERGSERQRQALALILTGELGGTAKRQFPWAFKESHPLGWRAAPIEIEHASRKGWFRAGEQVTLRVGDPVAHQEPVTCVIPGHHRSGVELHADVLRVEEGSLRFEVTGRCAYRATSRTRPGTIRADGWLLPCRPSCRHRLGD